MTTFLGVPVKVRGDVYGNLYLTEKGGSEEFTEEDEELLVILAEWAAIAIDNARSHSGLEARHRDLQRAVRGLEAIASLNRELERETDAERVLELVVKRGRALIDASACAVLIAEDRELTISAVAGEFDPGLVGTRIERPWLFEMMRATGVQRIPAGAVEATVNVQTPGKSLLFAPLRSRGTALGALIALEPGDGGESPVTMSSCWGPLRLRRRARSQRFRRSPTSEPGCGSAHRNRSGSGRRASCTMRPSRSSGP